LNFEAIVARLDFTYADKTPVRVIQQELDTMRQGELSLNKYYDEIEKTLTLLTNKTLTAIKQPTAAAVLNQKLRSGALHNFVSGLRKPLRLAVFPAQPKDMPSALALAQEPEAANDRCAYAASLARFANENEKPQ